MKFNSVQLKQIIKEEISKVLKEEMSEEERMQKRALLDVVAKINNKKFNFNLKGLYDPDATYLVVAEYKKGKDRHVAGNFIEFGQGLDFKITYDIVTQTYTINLMSNQGNITESGNDAVAILKKVVSEAKRKKLKDEIEFKDISGPTKPSYSHGDWERDGGGTLPTAKASDIWGSKASAGSTEYVHVPHFKRKSKWRI